MQSSTIIWWLSRNSYQGNLAQYVAGPLLFVGHIKPSLEQQAMKTPAQCYMFFLTVHIFLLKSAFSEHHGLFLIASLWLEAWRFPGFD